MIVGGWHCGDADCHENPDQVDERERLESEHDCVLLDTSRGNRGPFSRAAFFIPT